MLIQIPLDGVWANVKDWSWPQLCFALATITLVLLFFLARRVLRTGTQTFEGQQEDRRDSVSVLREQLNREIKRADEAEKSRNKAIQERDEIQQELNGWIWMDKHPALLRERAAELEAMQQEPAPVLSAGSILVVEDYEDARKGLALQLSLWGYSVEQAENAAEAHSQCDIVRGQIPFDVILLDEMMPDKSGQEFARELRDKGDNTPIIFLTAAPEKIDLHEMSELGISDVMKKPTPKKKLATRLQEILS